MTCLEKVRTFVKRCGAPAKFVAKSIVGIAVPGSAPVMELIDKLIDCAHDTVKDNLEELASREDLARVEKMFDRMLGDMQDIVEHLRRLEDVPDLARKTLYAALRNDEHCLAAAKGIAEQAVQLSAVSSDLAKLSAGQDDLRDLQRRSLSTLLDYVEEQRQHDVSPSQLNERLKQIEQALLAGRHGDHDRAEAVFVKLLTAAKRRLPLSDLQAGLSEERLDHARLPSQAINGEVELLVQFLQVTAHSVAHLHVLEIVPTAFVPGIQVRRVPRQRLHPYLPVRPRHELRDFHPAMNGRAIPDYQ